MCLAVPGRVVEIDSQDDLLRSARVDFGGVVRQASLACLPEATVGDYVLVHAGFAISRLDEEEARATLLLLAELEPGPEP
jgi:hydrogenase expression/formation protein HypC